MSSVPTADLRLLAVRSGAILLVVLLAVLYVTGSPADAQDVIEGETTVVNLRETDGRLGPLVMTLVVMGAGTLFATLLFGWMTRPKRRHPERNAHG